MYKVSLMLQSGHRSGHQDFIFGLFIECVEFNFYLYLYVFFTQHESVKRNLTIKWTPGCSFLEIHLLN